MPLLTTVIDDKSPLISYDATWLPGTSQDDSYAVDYYLGTFQKNSAPDGTATFSFNGSAFWIYGANRPNHGLYTVQVDGGSYPSINGSGNNLFQQSLFNASVTQGMHSVKLINTGGASLLYVDIDMIAWQSEVGSAGDQLVPELVSDTDSRFQYQEPAWGTTSPSTSININLFNNGTGHITNIYDASVTFTFIVRFSFFKYQLKSTHVHAAGHAGEAVTLFGTSGPSNGPYSVQLDGGQATDYNASNAYPTNYGVTIYHADNLGPGSHQLVLTNLPGANGDSLSIDYAQVWTIVNSSSSSCTPSSTGPGVLTSSQNGLSSGAIAGLVVEGVVALLAAAAAIFFFWRWRVALATPHTVYTPIFRSPETTTATATATGIAPTLETRSNPTSLRNDTSFQPMSAIGRTYQLPGNNHGAQDAAPAQVVSDFPIMADSVSSPSHSSMEDGRGLVRRQLPEAPGGGLPLSAELPKLSGGLRRESVRTVDSIGGLPPPNYNTVVGRS